MAKYSPIESEFETPEDEAAYDVWFRAKVEAALADPSPSISHDQVMAELRTMIAAKKSKPA